MMKNTYSRVGFSVVALYGVLSVVSGIIVGILFVGVLFTDLSNTFLSLGKMDMNAAFDLMKSEKYADLVLLGSTIGSAVGMLAGIGIMRLILKKREVQPIKKRDFSAKELLLVILVTYGFWGTGALIGNLPEFFGVLSLHLKTGNQNVNLLFAAYAVIGAPILEELAFRKLLLDRVHPYGELLAALASALLFGLFHGNAAQFPLAFGVGFMLSLVYLKTGRISYCIAIHLLINLTGVLPELFSFANLNVTIPWYVLVSLLTVGGIIAWVLNRKLELFTLKRSTVPDANRQAFKNPGMLFAVIGGLVLVGITEITLLVGAFTPDAAGKMSPLPLVRLIPIAVLVITVVSVLTKSWKRTDPEWTDLSGEEYVSGDSDV